MSDKVGPKNERGPWLLEAANFTPARRTPWGGRRIVETLKPGVHVSGPVGEAWELSVEPDFPSRLDGGPLLSDALREAGFGQTALLVKLLDAADDLSLQIHPRDEDAALGPDESGKPEAWYILDAEPGAGLYLGFRRGVTRQEVERLLQSGGRVDQRMHFVPVTPGDVFVLEPGTPHAIGKGVLLIEPQRVAPGKRGVTYRYWDWNRTYDENGQPDSQGQPRELHAQRALDVTDWAGPREAELLERICYRGGPATTEGSARVELLCSPSGPLVSSTFLIERLCGSGVVELPARDALSSVTVIEGTLRFESDAGPVEVSRGRTAALLSGEHYRASMKGCHALLCSLEVSS